MDDYGVRREIIGLGIVLLVLFIVYTQYQYSQNHYFTTGIMGFWLNFAQNVTKVNSFEMELNYLTKEVNFNGEFLVKDKGIAIDLDPIGFNKEKICDANLTVYDLNKEEKLYKSLNVGSVNKRDIERDPKDSIIGISGKCKLGEDMIPNYGLDIMISNNTESLLVDDVTVTVIFDGSKFGCRERCIYNNQLSISDEDSAHNERLIKLQGKQIDTRILNLDLRTFDKSKEFWSSFWYAILIGLIFLVFHILYDIYKSVRRK